MKRIYFLAVLFSGMLYGQIVDIPDANFKDRLLAAEVGSFIAWSGGATIKIDANSNGLIEVPEVMVVDSLNVQISGIDDMTGIEAFGNLKLLSCGTNNLTSLDVSGLTQLQKLYCSQNDLTSLDVSNCPNLEILYCSENLLTSLNVTGLSSLKHLDCSENSLAVLEVSTLNAINHLDCADNNLSALDVGPLTALTALYCARNQIGSLDVAPLTNLQSLMCSQNNLTTISLSTLSNLIQLEIGNAGLEPLDFEGLTSLMMLHLFLYDYPTIDLSPLSLSLQLFTVHSTQLTTVDVSGQTQLSQIQLMGNALLETVFAKNGNTMNFVYVAQSPALEFICANESDVAMFQQQISMDAQNNNTEAVVNTYCSFTPGGDFNTITGTVIFDADNNGCNPADGSLPLIKVTIDDANQTGATFNNSDGEYLFYTGAGTFTVAPSIENAAFFNISPPSAVIDFPSVDGLSATQNFCLTANGVHPDVEVAIVPLLLPRPGFDASYNIVIRNKGNQTYAGPLSFSFMDEVLDMVSASPAPSSQSAGELTWNITALLPFESRSFELTLNVNGPLDDVPVNIDDELNFNALIDFANGDDFPDDNEFHLQQLVVGSYDPNNKICPEGDVVSTEMIGDYLHYVINFENTGTAPATNIVVKDVINESMFDISTLQIMNSSHPVNARLTGNVAEFIFQNINLDIGGHGNILLKIKTLPNLTVGSEVSNRADIFFDYNWPIDTGFAFTRFQSLGIGDPGYDNSVRIYPNPAAELVLISAGSPISTIELFDVQGRLLQMALEGEIETSLDLSGRQSGVYFVKVTSTHGTKTEKIIKL